MAFEEDKKAPIPGWLVSFGDMMTLILTFFILLVSMASEQNPVTMASGIGSFEVALSSHGLPGLLTGDQRREIFNRVRARFELPPLEPGEMEMLDRELTQDELLPVDSISDAPRHVEVMSNVLAVFAPGAVELDPSAARQLARKVVVLKPRPREILVIEAHGDGDSTGADRDLAWARAEGLRQVLVRKHGFAPASVEARVPWSTPPDRPMSGLALGRLRALKAP